ncbi:hypothetical protein IFM89_019794 [Coptis chinensis]|uniref:Cation/H+ exchanger transmembrane domain-containing protein n=1 Tax=Coptis chinensis TaxID=261450 RepID=A0A835M8K6_9MAGN|nr:hypothetical protein IFM89_019794 [Coptis chinensis]
MSNCMGLLIWIFVVLVSVRVCVSGRSDKETRERFYGNLSHDASPPATGEGSIAKMFDRVLEKEFSENDQPDGPDASSFNSTVADQQAVLETVAKVTHEKPKKNDTLEKNGTRPFQFQDVFSLENEDSDDTTTLIDKKDNVFVMSNKKSKYPVLQVDLRRRVVVRGDVRCMCIPVSVPVRARALISDLVVVIVSATIGGIAFSFVGQPVIVGYLLAGSMIGPGGFSYISEMVQVETVAQFGVVFLLFALGLEFSLTKLKVVAPVAVLGGLLQIFVFMCLCGTIALICGASLSEGVFVGFFLSMSSTAVVLKFLVDKNSNNALHGQVTIGTLIFQDCAVGVLFALLPVLGGNSGLLQGIVSMAKLLLLLSTFLIAASILSWSFIPRFLKLMIRLSSQTNELYQLASVAFCLLSAWSCFFHGLNPYEDLEHSIYSREVLVCLSRGLTEPGTLFIDLVTVLRDVVLCYDGTSRNVCSNSIIQFSYEVQSGMNDHRFCPSCEHVGAFAATAISNPSYKVVLDSSSSCNASWELMKCSDKLGLSLELGSFVAGVMISTTDFAQRTSDQFRVVTFRPPWFAALICKFQIGLHVEPIRNLFAALFLSSIGMLINVHFLWSHVDILLASVILVIIVKTTVITIVTKAFGYSIRTSFLVGVSLAQIGEFAFVLLSRASNLHLVEGKMYLLLLGTTALSLVTTPIMFKVIPALMHLGVLMHWFPSESNTQNEVILASRSSSTEVNLLPKLNSPKIRQLGHQGVGNHV